MEALRAIYGCLESALLWYHLYSSTLQQMDFKLNRVQHVCLKQNYGRLTVHCDLLCQR